MILIMSERYKPHMYSGENDSHSRFKFPKNEVVPLLSIEGDEAELITAVKESLDQIHITVLKSIYQEYYGRAGLDTKLVDIPQVSEISLINDPTFDANAGFNHETGIILINIAQLHDVPKTELPELLKHIFIHECWHRISTGTPQERIRRETGTAARTVEQKIGVGGVVNANTRNLESREITHTTEYQLEFIDEGLTEILTTKTLREYNHRTGEYNKSIETDFNRGFGVEFYRKNQLKVRLLILFYSTVLNTTEDLIENSLTRAYLRNGAIVPSELSLVLPNFDPKILEAWLDKPDDIAAIEQILTQYLPEFTNVPEVIQNFYRRVLSLVEAELVYLNSQLAETKPSLTPPETH
jgi:hypothetical protein